MKSRNQAVAWQLEARQERSRQHRAPERLWERWRHWAAVKGDEEAIVHWTAGQEPHRWTWSALVNAATAYAEALAAAGVKAGEVCALIVRHNPLFYPAYLGVSALGAIPSVLAYPNPRLHHDKFAHGVAGMSRRSGLDWILTERSLEEAIRPLLHGSGSVRGLLFPLEWEAELGRHPGRERQVPQGVDPASPCLLQHSSGTTGLQKAVMLSHRAVLEHAECYADAIHLRPADKVVSWLPLYHDMGMIAAFQMPLAFGVPLVQLDPFEWVSAPILLLEAIAKERATLTWLPNFSYNLLVDRVSEEELDGVRLDCVRMFINCSEPVRAESHERFLARFASVGVKPEALSACYAMAETTFAATQTAPGRQAKVLEVDRDALSRGLVVPASEGAPVRRCVSSGRPIERCELRILGQEGAELADGHIGEIAIRSRTMFDGYRNCPEETAGVLKEGWYHSGDYGFLMDGECYVIGRKKDVIIVAGKNVYPEDVEDAVAGVPGITPGRVVAFGVDDEVSGTEQIWVVAESHLTDPQARRELRLAVRRAGSTADLTVSRVYLPPPRWLIKSSAGKPSRKANRERIVHGGFTEEEEPWCLRDSSE